MAPLALVPNLVTRWQHLHLFKIWSLDGATCISYNCIATLPWIVLLTLSVSIELVSSSARVTSVKFQKGVSVSDRDQTHRSDQEAPFHSVPKKDKKNSATSSWIFSCYPRPLPKWMKKKLLLVAGKNPATSSRKKSCYQILLPVAGKNPATGCRKKSCYW